MTVAELLIDLQTMDPLQDIVVLTSDGDVLQIEDTGWNGIAGAHVLHVSSPEEGE